MRLKVGKTDKLAGTLQMPGDKSISHRALMIGALAKGRTRVAGFLPAADCLRTYKCLSDLGVEIKQKSPTGFELEGKDLFGFRKPLDLLNAGNSGTTMRVLSGILAGQKFESTIVGDESLNKRPMKRVIEPLSLMGAGVEGKDDSGLPPLKIHGSDLEGIEYQSPVSSAQVKSAVLLAGILAEGETCLTEPSQSRDHTERMLEFFGAEIETEGVTSKVLGKQSFKGTGIEIPGDISSALFFMVAAILTEQSDLLLENIGINPTRYGAVEVLKEMGAKIEELDPIEISNELRSDIYVRSSRLKAVTIGKEMIPKLIDELPILAVAATQAEGKMVVKDAAELRVKETDRISAIVTELKKMGADIEEKKDGFIVNGPTGLTGCSLETYGDHRMAMALTIAGFIAEGTTIIEGAECISVSFPNFSDILKSVSR